jgi:hypothetical protein
MATNDVGAVIDRLRADNTFDTMANDIRLQFGTSERPYVGATLLPERRVESNQFTEEDVSYRTIIANDGSRYGPSQLKRGEIVGEVDVKLAEQDLAREFTGREFDAWRRLVRSRGMNEIVQLTNWVDKTLIRGMLDKMEVQRWQAIVGGSVPLRGDNGYRDSMTYSNPAGHRIVAAATFANAAVDPFDLFAERVAFLKAKGYTIRRIIMSTQKFTDMMNNPKVRARAGGAVISTSGSVIGVTANVSQTTMNGLFAQQGLPTPELYDAMYRTSTATSRFLQVDAVVLVAGTERDESIDTADVLEIVSGTIGYHAIGTAVGQDTPGRVLNVEAILNKKPPRIEGEIFQTAAPVILEPEAFSVVTGV